MSRIADFFKRLQSKPKPSTDKLNIVSVTSMELKYKNEDLIGAAKELKNLLEEYGRRKRKNHRHKGRVFIYFILSNKHKDLKNTGYTHWQNLNEFIKLNPVKVYPYHKNNLRNAMTFFEKEIKGLSEIKISM